MPKKPKYNEVACPKCKEPMAVSASICPHCRTEFSSKDVARRVKDQQWAVGVAFGFLAIIVLGTIVWINRGDLKEASEASATVEASEAASTPTSEPAKASPEAKAAAITFYKSIMSSLSGCDAASKETADVTKRMPNGGASIYDGYTAAKAQEEACQSSWSDVNNIDVPPELPSDARDAADEAKDRCADAALAKKAAAQSFQVVFDGDMRPSKIDEAKQAATESGGAQLRCALGTVMVATKAGVDVKDLPGMNK